MVLREELGPKSVEITGDQRKLHNEEYEEDGRVT
jgi:hypothetical protein